MPTKVEAQIQAVMRQFNRRLEEEKRLEEGPSEPTQVTQPTQEEPAIDKLEYVRKVEL